MTRNIDFLTILIAFLCMHGNSQAQTRNPSASTKLSAIQVPRESLHSLFYVTGNEEFVTLGNLAIGRTNGLEGIVYREGNNRDDSDSGGYIRWHVIFRRIDGKAFTRDEQLRMEFLAMYTGHEPEVVHWIELLQGDLKSHSSFLAPSYSKDKVGYYWQNTLCRVYSDGRELKGLKGLNRNGYNNAAQQSAAEKATQSVAVVSLKTLRVLSYSAAELSNVLNQIHTKERWLLPKSHFAVLENLPTDWRELAAKPSLAIDADELETCTPEQTMALRQFVLAGGQMIIADCPVNPVIRQDIDAWITAFVPSIARHPQSWVSKKDGKLSHMARFLPLGFGQLVLYSGDIDRFNQTKDASSIFHEMPRLDRIFSADLMNWMIPKLGQPPVFMFCLSIGTFAVMAGPALLWWTNVKIRRPIWLLLLFPLFAVLITSSIFAYALFHDGFGTSGRIRSMTWVDAESGFGCAYSRQTYFSGFPPSSVQFQHTSEVWEVPSPNKERQNYYRSEPVSDVSLEAANERQIYRGLLTAREQKQWIVTTPVEGLKPLEWLPATGDTLPRVRNLLSEAWQLGIFVDGDKHIFAVDRVAKESDHELQSISLEDARKWLNDSIPKLIYPVGYIGNGPHSLFDWLSGTSRNYAATFSGLPLGMRTDMEAMIENWPNDELTKPNRFLIILERANHIDRPFTVNVNETDSSHIMMGIW